MVDPYIGQINMIAFGYAPRGWALCDGQLLSIAEHSALFALLGTRYGGDGRSTFALPDLRGRVPLHPGNGPGLSTYTLGQMGGVEHVVLHQSQLAQHHHGANTGTLTVAIPAVNREGNSTAPGSDKSLSIVNTGERPATQYPAYSGDAPDSSLRPGTVSGSVTIDNTGDNQPHENRQPLLAVNFVIALDGSFPPRP